MNNQPIARYASLKDLNNYFKIKDLLRGLTTSQQDTLRKNIGVLKEYIYNTYIDLTDEEIDITTNSYNNVTDTLSNTEHKFYFILNSPQSKDIKNFYLYNDGKLRHLPDLLYLPNALNINISNFDFTNCLGINASKALVVISSCQFTGITTNAQSIKVNHSSIQEIIGKVGVNVEVSNCLDLRLISGAGSLIIDNCPNIKEIIFAPNSITTAKSIESISTLSYLTSDTIDSLIEALVQSEMIQYIKIHNNVEISEDQNNKLNLKNFYIKRV